MKYFSVINMGLSLFLAWFLSEYSPLIPGVNAIVTLTLSLWLCKLDVLLSLVVLVMLIRQMVLKGFRRYWLGVFVGNFFLMLIVAYIGLELWAKSQMTG